MSSVAKRARKYCTFDGCKNNDAKGYRLFAIGARRRKTWLSLCGLPDNTPKHAYICDGHFTREDFEEITDYGNVRLKNSAQPSNLVPNPPKLLTTEASDIVTQFGVTPVLSNGTRKSYYIKEDHASEITAQPLTEHILMRLTSEELISKLKDSEMEKSVLEKKVHILQLQVDFLESFLEEKKSKNMTA